MSRALAEVFRPAAAIKLFLKALKCYKSRDKKAVSY
jgi:hypothetical protein